MDDLAMQIDNFRRLMTDDAYRRLQGLQQLDGAMTEVDEQLLEYLDGMFRRHGDRRQQIIARLIDEAQRYGIVSQQPQDRPAVAQDGDLRAPRILGGGSMPEPSGDEFEGSHDRPENWSGYRGPYQGWQ